MKYIKRSKQNLILHYDPEIEPICSIKPGEIIQVETADAEEFVKDIKTNDDIIPEDFNEDYVTPATGPFYVEGAEPGDTLLVEFLAIDIVPPSFTCALKGIGLTQELFENAPATFVYEVKNNYLYLNEDIRYPIEPMVGIIGTTPPEKTRVFLIGDHGGNVDDPDSTTGSYIYLPVYHKGALIALGDVHAAQGKGETLMGVETDSVVTLRVNVLKNIHVDSMQIETRDKWVISATGYDSFDETITLAAHRMAKFLMERLDLTIEEATAVMCAKCNYGINSALGKGYFYALKAEINKDIDAKGRLSGAYERDLF